MHHPSEEPDTFSPYYGPDSTAEFGAEYACLTCYDGGFVKTTRSLKHPDFGKVSPCPDCVGNLSGEADDVSEQRMRIPLAYSGAHMGQCSPGQMQAVEAIASSPYPEKPIVVLQGNAGAGKTFAAVVGIKEFRRRHGKHATFWPVVDLLEEFRRTFAGDRATRTVEDIEAELRRSWWLVLDDWGKQKSTEWVEQQLYRVVNQRWSERKPLVVTTNNSPDDFDPAVFSRLFGDKTSTVITFAGNDRRFSS